MSSCDASSSTYCPRGWFAFATSDSSPTAGAVLRSNIAALCSARPPASIRPSHPACAVQPAPASCWSSNGSPALNFTSVQASPRPSQGGAPMTALERLNDRPAPIHPSHVVRRHAPQKCVRTSIPAPRTRLQRCGTSLHFTPQPASLPPQPPLPPLPP